MRHPVVAALHVVPFDGSREKLVDDLVQIVEDGVYVLAVRDGFAVSRELARERANNIVMAIMCAARVTSLDGDGGAA